MTCGMTVCRSGQAAGLYVARYLVPGPALPETAAQELRAALAMAPELACMDTRRLVTVWADTRGYLLMAAGWRRSPVRCASGWNGVTRVVHCLAHAELVAGSHRFRSGLRMSPRLVGEFVERVVEQAQRSRPVSQVQEVRSGGEAWVGPGLLEPAGG